MALLPNQRAEWESHGKEQVLEWTVSVMPGVHRNGKDIRKSKQIIQWLPEAPVLGKRLTSSVHQACFRSDNPRSAGGVSSSVPSPKKTMNSSDLAKLHNFKKRRRKPEDGNFTEKNQLALLSFLLRFPFSLTPT